MAEIPFASAARTAVSLDNFAASRLGVTSIRWSAVIAGVVGAISTQCLLTVLGVALGVSEVSISSVEDAQQVSRISAAAAAWWLISGCAALTLGGMIVGWTSGLLRGNQLHLNAFTMWAVTAVFGFVIVWSGGAPASNLAMYALATTEMNGAQQREQATVVPHLRAGAEAGGPATDVFDAATPREQVVRVARAASWWSVIGLLAGCAATLGGAWLAVPAREASRRAT